MHVEPAHVFHEDRSPADVEAGSQIPSVGEVLEAYVDARRSGGAPAEEVEELREDLAWFLAVCYYKTASTIAVIHKRDRKRSDPDPTLAVAASHLDDVLDAGHRVLDES